MPVAISAALSMHAPLRSRGSIGNALGAAALQADMFGAADEALTTPGAVWFDSSTALQPVPRANLDARVASRSFMIDAGAGPQRAVEFQWKADTSAPPHSSSAQGVAARPAKASLARNDPDLGAVIGLRGDSSSGGGQNLSPASPFDDVSPESSFAPRSTPISSGAARPPLPSAAAARAGRRSVKNSESPLIAWDRTAAAAAASPQPVGEPTLPPELSRAGVAAAITAGTAAWRGGDQGQPPLSGNASSWTQAASNRLPRTLHHAASLVVGPGSTILATAQPPVSALPIRAPPGTMRMRRASCPTLLAALHDAESVREATPVVDVRPAVDTSAAAGAPVMRRRQSMVLSSSTFASVAR